ncbi:tyrosinase family protein [Dyadobacter sp. CY326]|uniref:tyrosinase family protein n=1 Tax=Dyadobacter sp. CY326 TaxID=2907300 RepID=UPI001F161DEA|nr:tyrosinase family protein [Dyadobacter sp. CY326]MCE7065272.1 tyrosinase family protein [Dyadobacter sp. CY326]
MGSLTKKDKAANAGLERARAIPPNTAPTTTATVEITINGAASGNVYLGWQLCACSIRIANQPQQALNVTLKNKSTAGGGQIRFRTTYTGAAQDTLALTLPGNGTPVNFFIGGKFGSPSVDDQDNSLVAVETASNAVLAERTFMVRVRKNSESLTTAERDIFLNAVATLNSSAAEYQRYLDGHGDKANNEIHGRPSFLPWHRAFVLDYERRLQAIDPRVSLPYWRFDEPAPKLFSRDFMGGTIAGDGQIVNPTNPLHTYTPIIVRVPRFDTVTQAAFVMSQKDTIESRGADFLPFSDMEDNPHGFAHTSFTAGDRIRNVAEATMDPLFFMLHGNVDRLWAKWQKDNNRWVVTNPSTYSPQSGNRIGENAGDTMWPWNGDTTFPRPDIATGGHMPQLTFPAKPSPLITVAETIDYIGRIEANRTHFDYDDVSFE